jgi:glucose/arabinose dehydrogenase
MRRLIVLLATLLLAGCSPASGPVTSPAPPPALVDIGDGLHGPAGFVASSYATGLANVASFAFDDGGRLWVSTAGYEDDGTDAVYLVAMPGFAPTKVLGGIHTPLGLLWLGGELYVASKGRVDAYSDLAGSTFAAHRTVLVLPDGVGEVNGLVASPDGRLILGISAPCDACHPTSEYAAAVVSVRTDGTDLRVEASGIRARPGSPTARRAAVCDDEPARRPG